MAITDRSAPPGLQTQSDGAGERPGAGTAGVTLGEVLVGGAAVLLGLLSWSGLALAHARHYSLPAALALTAVGAGLLALVVWRAAPLRLRLRQPRADGIAPPASALGWRPVADRGELAVLVGLALVAGLLFFPGFPYGLGDKDPGTYVSHGISIARTGDWQLPDPVLDRSRVPAFQPASPGARLAGIWYTDVNGGVATPQFYHLWPAALASAYALGGLPALVNLNPLLGVLAVLAGALAVKRAFGLPAGALAGLLLATCMLQVWQAKYQSAEVLTELFVLTALLGVGVALRTGWRPAAGIAGLLVGLSWLARADGLLLVLLAVGVGCVLIVLGRFDGRAAWFAGGLALVLPHALLQAYDFARAYTLSNGVPGLAVVAVLIVGLLGVAVALRVLARPLWERLDGWLAERGTQAALGLALTALAALGMLLGFLRPWLFGEAWFNYNGRIIRSYDEQTMRRLSWFLTLPGMGLVGLGIALVALRRWRAAAWAVVLPALLIFPVYAVRAENSSRLLWWNRRFVPVVLPGLVTLIAVALVAGLLWDGRLALALGRRELRLRERLGERLRLPVRVAAGALALFLVAAFLSQSLPLRGHHEFAGSFEISQRMADAAGGRQGVFLFEPPKGKLSPASAFAAPLWLQHGQISVLLRVKPSPAYVDSFVRSFPGQPVFLVGRGGGPPVGYESLALHRVEHVQASLPMWDERDDARPSAAHAEPVDLSIWQVDGT